MKNTKNNINYKMQMGGEQEQDILSFLSQYAQSKGINPEELIADFQKATPEQQEEFLAQIQNTETMQYGGAPFDPNSAKSLGKKTALTQANWLSDWYGTRNVVTDPIQIDPSLYAYESSMNPNSRTPEIAKDIKDIKEGQNLTPAAYYKKETPFNKGKTVFLSPVAKTTYPVHEFTHAIDSEYGDYGTMTTPNILRRAKETLFGTDLKTDYTDLDIKPLMSDKYVTRPEETYARLNELRYKSKYDPNYKPTIEDIKKLRQTNKKNALFQYYDDESIQKMWNGLSANSENPYTLDNPMIEQTAQYGGIPKNKNGVFATGKFPVIVPTEGTGNISMRGVPFDIQAYDNKTMEYLGYMEPEQEYDFDADEILEIPVAQYGGNIDINDNQIEEYSKDILKDNSFYGTKYGELLRNTMKKYIKDEINLDEYNSVSKYVIQKYLKEKHKNDKPIDYLTVPKKYPVKAKDFNSFSNSQKPVYTAPDSTIQYSGNTYAETPKPKSSIKPRVTSDNNFITGLKGFATGKDMIPVYKDSWVEEWSAIDPDFKKKSFAQQQAFAKDWTKKNAPDYYQGIGKTFKGYDIDKMTSDKKFGSITNQLRPSLAKGNLTGLEESLPIVEDFNPVITPRQQFTKEQLASVDSQYTPLVQEKGSQALKSISPELLELGTLTDKDYFSPYLSNAKRRANRVMSPYFKDVNLTTPQLYQEDVSPYLANITRQTRGAVQNINPNSTVGQSVAQQIASNAAFQANTIQGQIANRNLERQNAWQNQVLGIQNQQAALDDANRAQYVDDWARTLTNKDNIENLIDMQAANYQMQKQKQENEMALLDATLNNIDFIQTPQGRKIVQKKTSDFKNPWESLSDAQVMSQYMKKDTKTAKFGLKKKAPY